MVIKYSQQQKESKEPLASQKSRLFLVSRAKRTVPLKRVGIPINNTHTNTHTPRQGLPWRGWLRGANELNGSAASPSHHRHRRAVPADAESKRLFLGSGSGGNTVRWLARCAGNNEESVCLLPPHSSQPHPSHTE